MQTHREPNLLFLQRRFMAALREPIYGPSRALTDLPKRKGAVSAAFEETANRLITPSATLTPQERLELYHRQYWFRLLDSIEEDFPALRRFLGDEPFRRLIERYLETVPPADYTLRYLGAELPGFIERSGDTLDYPVHAAELARIEYALCETFEAAEHPPLSPSKRDRIPIALQPHIILLALKTPAETIYRRAVENRPLPQLAPPARTPNRFAVVYREAYRLRTEPLSRAAFAILEGIARTGEIAHAVEQAADVPGLLRNQDAARISIWFEKWTSRGWFCRKDHSAEPRRAAVAKQRSVL